MLVFPYPDPEKVKYEKAYREAKLSIEFLRLHHKLCAHEVALSSLEEALGLKAGFNDDQPRIPAGSEGGGRWTSNGESVTDSFRDAYDLTYEDQTVPDTWANPDIDYILDHFIDHGDDFDATSPEDYAAQANNFLERFKNENLSAIEYPKAGKLGVYDYDTNSFGLYLPNGKTLTYYKPPDGPAYFEKQIMTQIPRGGRLINMRYPKTPESEGPIGGGTIGAAAGEFLREQEENESGQTLR